MTGEAKQGTYFDISSSYPEAMLRASPPAWRAYQKARRRAYQKGRVEIYDIASKPTDYTRGFVHRIGDTCYGLMPMCALKAPEAIQVLARRKAVEARVLARGERIGAHARTHARAHWPVLTKAPKKP